MEGLKNNKQLYIDLSIITITIVLTTVILWDYLIFPTVAWVGLCVLPVVARKGTAKAKSYLVIGVILLVLSLFIHMVTFYYVAICLVLLGGYIWLRGSLNHLPLFLLGIISPAFEYIKDAFGIPLRLKLSYWAGEVFQVMEMPVEVHGNLVKFQETSFMIDEGCAGLNLLTYGMLIAIILMSLKESQYRKYFTFWQVCLWLSVMLLLNIVSNFMRVTMLIFFKIMPENPFHDILGLFVFISCCLVPFYLLLQLLAKKMPREPETKKYTNIHRVLVVGLYSVLMIAGIYVPANAPNELFYTYSSPPGMNKECLENGVLKYSNKDLLIYEKPLYAFYSADHNPMICWKGSGYKMDKITDTVINGKHVFKAEIKNENSMLYTSWWFESDKHICADQLEWRKHALLNGEKFSLINVAAKDEDSLLHFLNRTL